MQRLVDRIKQHFTTSIRKKSNTVGEQRPRMCKNNNPKTSCHSAIGQHLLQIWNAPKHIQTIIFETLSKQDRPFIYMFLNQFTLRLKTQSCLNRESLFSHLQCSNKQWYGRYYISGFFLNQRMPSLVPYIPKTAMW